MVPYKSKYHLAAWIEPLEWLNLARGPHFGHPVLNGCSLCDVLKMYVFQFRLNNWITVTFSQYPNVLTVLILIEFKLNKKILFCANFAISNFQLKGQRFFVYYWGDHCVKLTDCWTFSVQHLERGWYKSLLISIWIYCKKYFVVFPFWFLGNHHMTSGSNRVFAFHDEAFDSEKCTTISTETELLHLLHISPFPYDSFKPFLLMPRWLTWFCFCCL